MSAASAFNLPIACRLLSGFGERLVGIYARLIRQRFRRVFKAGSGQEETGFLFANAQEPMPSDSTEPMALGFPHCRCLHTFFIRRRLLVIFVSATGRPVQWHWSRPWGVYFCAHARHAIEIDWQALSSQEQANVKDWLFAEGPSASSRQAPKGYSLIEALLAMPVVLLMGLLVVQLGFLAQQALTVNYAVGQSVREFGAAGGSLSKGLAL
ncbi:MAG: TadE/TadG family type IV pilus assembly protein, partial [Proteobacteria bacterium]|nr:TadE/TadG family type IV pilus assembly protein [Pseudomonadota bacterium]